jgi:Protein of unknown function (DUF2490)
MRKSATSTGSCLGLLFLLATSAAAQSSASGNEFWPRLNGYMQLGTASRLLVLSEWDKGEDFPYEQWKVGGVFTYQIARIRTPHVPEIDRDKEHHLPLGVGYEYLQTTQPGKESHENRISVLATPSLRPGRHLFLADRNLVEFRWKNGEYSNRYRNRLTVEMGLAAGRFRFTPYASGEVFYSSSSHSWNETQVAAGVHVPYRRLLMVDAYYLRQDCDTCSPNPLNVFGLTLNLYLRNGS